MKKDYYKIYEILDQVPDITAEEFGIIYYGKKTGRWRGRLLAFLERKSEHIIIYGKDRKMRLSERGKKVLIIARAARDFENIFLNCLYSGSHDNIISGIKNSVT